MFWVFPKMKQQFTGEIIFGQRGYFVNRVGINEDVIKCYVKYQGDKEKQEERHSKDFGLFQRHELIL